MDTKTETLIKEDLDKVSVLEKKISTEVSPTIFDYEYVLDPFSSNEIKLKSDLQDKQKNLLQEYIDTTKSLLTKINVEIDTNSKDLFELFLDCSHNIYLLRFTGARKLLAEYSFYRVPTAAEIQFSVEGEDPVFNKISIELEIPSVMAITEDGLFDIEQTSKNEQNSAIIRSTLSSFSILYEMANRMITELATISKTQYMVNMSQEKLYALLQDVLQIVIIRVNQEVYKYLSRGHLPEQSINNVKDYLSKITPKDNNHLPEILSDIETDIFDIIKEELPNIIVDKGQQKETFQDIVDLILHYCRTGDLVSLNFYKIEFVPFENLSQMEKGNFNLLNVYLMDDLGKTMSNVTESYNIDFSKRFKRDLFTLVTNNIVNPNFTLEDYLEE